MSIWSSNPASVAATQKYANMATDLDGAPARVIINNPSGSSTSKNAISDPYGGVPISLNTGYSAAGLSSASYNLGSDFEDLYNLIMQNTDKNNAFSAAQAQKQMDFQERMNQIAMEFNSLEAAKNRDWQEMMSNTAHQREIADLKAAGLNPVLSASGGNGAAVTSGATAQGVTSAGAKADADQSANGALASLYSALIGAQTQMYNANLSARTNLAIAEQQIQAQMYAAQLGAEASKYAAGTNYAAQAYVADSNFRNNEAQRQWNADHPSNAWQGVSSIVGGNQGVSSAKSNLKTLLGKAAGNVMHWIFDRD